MANIESRRKKRRLTGAAVIAGAVVLVAAIVTGIVFLSRSCGKNSGGEGQHAAASDTPAPTSAPTEIAAETQQTAETAIPTDAPTAAPAGTQSADTPAEVTPVPIQVTDERSFALYSIGVGSYLDMNGAVAALVSGSCAFDFVNNTGEVLYGAYIDTAGLAVSSASIDGAAVRFYTDEDGICLLPFAEELPAGGRAQLFIRFGGSVLAEDGFVLPHPAYDTVYDAVCSVGSDCELTFSSGSVKNAEGSSLVNLMVNADGVRTIEVGFVIREAE